MAKRRFVPPFLTLSDLAVRSIPAEGWVLQQNDQPGLVIADGEVLPSWDSMLTFKLRREYVLDVERALHELGFAKNGARLQCCTQIVTARGLFSLPGMSTDIIPGEPVVVEVEPDSTLLSRDLNLLTSIVLSSPGQGAGPLSPSIAGARLWRSSWTCRLEDGRARLPLEALSFERDMPSLAAPRALFQVHVAEYPDLEFDQAVCVYLNKDFPRFVTAVENGDPSAIAMLWDGVVRQVISFGTGSAFVHSQGACPPSSLGEHVVRWTQGAFPGQSLESLAATRRDSPGLFEARIQSWINAGRFWLDQRLA